VLDKVWHDLLHLARIPFTRLRVHQPHQMSSKAADRNLALTTSVYALTRFGQVRNPTRMRNRNQDGTLSIGGWSQRLSDQCVGNLYAVGSLHGRIADTGHSGRSGTHPISCAARPLAAASRRRGQRGFNTLRSTACRPPGASSLSSSGTSAMRQAQMQPPRDRPHRCDRYRSLAEGLRDRSGRQLLSARQIRTMPPALPGRTSVSAPSMACRLTRRRGCSRIARICHRHIHPASDTRPAHHP
jgi:hypothetical protein